MFGNHMCDHGAGGLSTYFTKGERETEGGFLGRPLRWKGVYLHWKSKPGAFYHSKWDRFNTREIQVWENTIVSW
jgi:hypothetical protein